MAEDSIKNFNFSFSLAQSAKKELEAEHSAMNERINNIVDSEKFFINSFPVLKNILVLSPTKADLKKLSKALDRLADLIEVFTDLDNKITVIETLNKNPSWFAWSCGDFTEEIDQGLESILNSKE